MSKDGNGGRDPDRNVEAIVRHVLAIDYAEMKLGERLSKIKILRKGTRTSASRLSAN